MRIEPKNFVIVALLALCAGLLSWWWHETTEVKWQQEHKLSDAFLGKPFIASSALLRQHGHAVRTESSLDLINLEKLPDGVLILGGDGGRSPIAGKARADLVRAWVARGNTLVFTPRERTRAEKAASEATGAAPAAAPESDADTAQPPADDTARAPDSEPAATGAEEETEGEAVDGAAEGDEVSEEEEEGEEGEEGDEALAEDDEEAASRVAPPTASKLDNETDPLGAQFGVRRAFVYQRLVCRTLTKTVAESEKTDKCPPGSVRANNLRLVQVPGMDPLSFDTPVQILALPDSPQPAWTDNQGDALRAYRHGKGHVVAMSTTMFRNTGLIGHDHGALLLALASLNPHKHVTIIESAKAVSWQRLLWQHFHAVIIGLAVLAALLFWAAVRRFGPAMPEPAPERRSLMEHINASGAWLWKVRGGRQVLIDAARADLQATLQRRAPALLRLHSQQQHKELAALTGLSEDDIASAMLDEPSAIEPNFTRQIRTLQTLRSHHER